MESSRGEATTDIKGKRTVLVVDDDRDYLAIATAVLSREYEVLCATTGETALVAARSTMPDVAIVDLALPGMSGLEIIRHLQSDSLTRGIPVLAISCRRFDGGMAEFLKTEGNVREYLDKASDPAALVSKVARLS